MVQCRPGSVVVTISTLINQAGVGQNISNQASFAYDRDLNGSNETTGISDDPTVAGVADATTFSVVTRSYRPCPAWRFCCSV